MSELTFHWYAGPNDESFSIGPCDTRQEAYDQAIAEDLADIQGDGFYLVEAAKADLKLSDYFDADDFIERANDRAYDLGNEDGDPVFEVLGTQVADLGFVVCAAIDRWQRHQKLAFVPWAFTATRNLEWVAVEPLAA